MISPHGPVESKELSDAQRIKRMCSGLLDANTLDATVGIGYISTPITVTAVEVYATATANNGALVIDVGIDGDDDAIVAAESIASITKDGVHECTIDTADVDANHMITASINTADGAGGTIQVAIEYYENE